MDNPQQDTGSQHYELFLQEIEGIDDYWGPTFRSVRSYYNIFRLVVYGFSVKSNPR